MELRRRQGGNTYGSRDGGDAANGPRNTYLQLVGSPVPQSDCRRHSLLLTRARAKTHQDGRQQTESPG